MLNSLMLKTLRDRRRSLFWWVVGIFGYLFAIGALYPVIADMQEELETLIEAYPEGILAIMGASSESPMFDPEGFLQVEATGWVVPLVFAFFGAAMGARAVAGEEDDGTIDLLLATPLTRSRPGTRENGRPGSGLRGVGSECVCLDSGGQPAVRHEHPGGQYRGPKPVGRAARRFLRFPGHGPERRHGPSWALFGGGLFVDGCHLPGQFLWRRSPRPCSHCNRSRLSTTTNPPSPSVRVSFGGTPGFWRESLWFSWGLGCWPFAAGTWEWAASACPCPGSGGRPAEHPPSIEGGLDHVALPERRGPDPAYWVRRPQHQS